MADAKKKADESQIEVEEIQQAKRKLDNDMKALQENIETLQAENNKMAKSKKKVQEEVSWEWLWVELEPYPALPEA